MTKPLVIFDIEATCDFHMPKNKREIIEIGAVKIQDGEIIDKFQCFAKPRKNSKLTEYCKHLTNIKQEDIDNANDTRIVMEEFFKWANNSILASWGDFDIEIINREIHKCKLNYKDCFAFVNLKRVYLAFLKLPSTYSLLDSLKREHIVFDGNQHRAYDDAYNTYLIYKCHIKEIDNMMKQFYPRSYFEIGKGI